MRRLTLISVAVCTFYWLQVAFASGTDLNGLPEEVSAKGEDETIPQAADKLSAIFDFNNYKRLFGRHYGSLAEELNRRRLYLSRCLRAVASGLSYKFYKSTSYNSLNAMSDRSAAELDQMSNRALDESQVKLMDSTAEYVAERKLEGDGDELPEFIVHEGEDLEEELKKLIEENPDEMSYERLFLAAVQKSEANKRARNKRNAPDEPEPDQPTARVREFPLEDLIHTEESSASQESPELTRQVRTNNPEYEPLELHSLGLTDQLENVSWENLNVNDERPLRDQIEGYLKSLREKPGGMVGKRLYKVDEMFHDLRKTMCFAPVRNQLHCGSCYAFASTAIMEWIYCKKTGKLVEFSEQYMIDCGRDRFKDLISRGCDGGDIFATAEFVHNFGVELRRNYPYQAMDGVCPYSESHDLKKTGYIRMELGRLLRVEMRFWPSYIKHGPMYVVVQTGTSKAFHDYGGGVDQCLYCKEGRGLHAMVLVGHGRHWNEEYWLLRNSFGPTWGVGGYWRLSKKAAEKFIRHKVGWMYGTTKDGRKLDFKPRFTNPRFKLNGQHQLMRPLD